LSLSEGQWRKLETVSRFLLSILIIVFVVVAAVTYERAASTSEQIKSGNCSYLVENGVVSNSSTGLGGSESLPEDYDSLPGLKKLPEGGGVRGP